jgi:soluble lytic murein transglycosylase-like protein
MRGQDRCILMSSPVQPVNVVSAEEAKYSRMVERASRAHGVEGALVHAVIRAESAYDPNAVSSAGASGLMQLMPDSAKQYGVRDIFDPAQNIQGGVRMLKDLLVMFDGDVELAIAAYNAGPYAVIRAGNRIPPQPQTLAYVPKVIGYYRGSK